jgi:hypothetical protein
MGRRRYCLLTPRPVQLARALPTHLLDGSIGCQLTPEFAPALSYSDREWSSQEGRSYQVSGIYQLKPKELARVLFVADDGIINIVSVFRFLCD